MTLTAENIDVNARGGYLIYNNGGTASNASITPDVNPVPIATLE